MLKQVVRQPLVSVVSRVTVIGIIAVGAVSALAAFTSGATQAQVRAQQPQYQAPYQVVQNQPAQAPQAQAPQAQAQAQAPQARAQAQAAKATPSQSQLADDPAFWSFSAGWFDINKQKNEAFEGRIEYRDDHKFWGFKPFGGVMATSDRAAHVYAGILMDLYFGRRWVITPSFAPGWYHEGDGKKISDGIQFRSQLEIAYRFDDRSRIGISINHISNAGINDPNPGSETLALTYSIPTSGWLGR